MSLNRNLYEILGVDEKATQEEIKAAYRKRVRETHPDRHPEKAEEFKEINNAYNDFLSDPKKRKKYDSELEKERNVRRDPGKQKQRERTPSSGTSAPSGAPTFRTSSSTNPSSGTSASGGTPSFGYTKERNKKEKKTTNFDIHRDTFSSDAEERSQNLSRFSHFKPRQSFDDLLEVVIRKHQQSLQDILMLILMAGIQEQLSKKQRISITCEILFSVNQGMLVLFTVQPLKPQRPKGTVEEIQEETPRPGRRA